MSKKSRRRNKRLLMLAALAGGAALMGRGRGTAQGVSGSDKAKFTSDAAYSPAPVSPAPVTGVTNPNAAAAAAAAAASTTGAQTKYKTKVDGRWMGPNELRMHRARTAGNLVPPSMRGGALHAEGFQHPGRNIRGKLGKTVVRPSYNLYKKGGSVTGIAKRGFGRALKKGKK